MTEVQVNVTTSSLSQRYRVKLFVIYTLLSGLIWVTETSGFIAETSAVTPRHYFQHSSPI